MRKRIQLILFGVCVFAGVIGIVAPVRANEKATPADAIAPAVTHQGAVSNQGAQVIMDPNAVAVIPTDSFDFGSVDEGKEVFHDFMIKNGGTADLKIINVKSG